MALWRRVEHMNGDLYFGYWCVLDLASLETFFFLETHQLSLLTTSDKKEYIHMNVDLSK